jgi:hypothetical protein
LSLSVYQIQAEAGIATNANTEALPVAYASSMLIVCPDETMSFNKQLLSRALDEPIYTSSPAGDSATEFGSQETKVNTLKIALLSAALVTSGAAFAATAPEGNGHVDVAAAAADGNGHVDITADASQGNGQVGAQS